MKDNFLKVVLKTAFLLVTSIAIIASGCNNQEQNEKNQPTQFEADTIPQKDSVVTLDDLNTKIRENPLNPEVYVDRAAFYAVNKEFGQALNDMELALKLDSLNHEYYIMQAEYYIFNGQPNSAKKALNDYLNLFPNHTDIMLKLAEIHFYLQEYSQAQLILRNVTTLDDDIAQIYFLNGLIFLENQDTLNGVRNLQLSVEKEPDFYAGYMMLGRIYAEQNNELAITYFKSAIDIAPDSYEARYNLALYLQDMERIEEAEQEYTHIIEKIDSEAASPYYNLGYIHLIYKADFETAVDYFTQAIERDSNYVEAWYNRGFSYEVMGDLKEARTDYEQSLEIQSNYPLSIKGLNRLDTGKPFKLN